MTKFLVCALLLLISCLALGQELPAPGSIYWVHPNQQVRVVNLPQVAAAAQDPSAVLAAALEMVLHDKAVCCGSNSALATSVQGAALPLSAVAARLQGRHALSDGRPISIRADYVPQSAANSDLIIAALRDQHAPLIEFKSQLYVLYGAIFTETRYYNGSRQFAIQKLLLLDPRYSGPQRRVELNRESGDWASVQGLLTVTVQRL